MDVSAYLSRIRYAGTCAPVFETLRALHQVHLLAIPFENLSIARGEPIVLEEDALFTKIVTRRRGGFCYELNGLFAALLRELGFNVTLLSARVKSESGRVVPEFDHLVLRVQLDHPWLADVGFGDGFREPLQLDTGDEQAQGERSYRIVNEGADCVMQNLEAGEDWHEQYRFTLQPCQLNDFAGMCLYHQTSPESIFTRKRICSLATPAGRMTLSDMKFIVTDHGKRTERLLSGMTEEAHILRTCFHIDLAP